MKKAALLASLALLSVTACHRRSESADTQSDYAVPDDQPSPAAAMGNDEQGNEAAATGTGNQTAIQGAKQSASGSPAPAH